jgi:hypothetical protein
VSVDIVTDCSCYDAYSGLTNRRQQDMSWT